MRLWFQTGMAPLVVVVDSFSVDIALWRLHISLVVIVAECQLVEGPHDAGVVAQLADRIPRRLGSVTLRATLA